MRTRVAWVVVLLALLTSISLLAYSHGQPIRISRERIVSIRLQPEPEGPVGTLSAIDGGDRFRRVLRQVPIPLPHPAWQWGCSQGGTMIITLDTGQEIRYGPCRRPASINELWTRVIAAMEE